MRILIVVPEQDRISGNWITARRFQQGLEAKDHQVDLLGVELQAADELRQRWSDFAPEITILLHAYRSGKPWREATQDFKPPFVTLLTGTDLNQGLNDPIQKPIIHAVLRETEYILLQNPLLVTEFTKTYPDLAAKLKYLPPGINLGKAPYKLRGKQDLNREKTLFLCPAGLRPVKGVLELLEMFDLVASKNSEFQLIFCGPILDQNYGEHFLAAIKQRPWACYLGSIPAEMMASAMQEADVILNNSQTEGLANTLLEAATLQIPILARNIPGNAAIVEHNRNGLLYSSQEEFCQQALRLLNQENRKQLSCFSGNKYDAENETKELMKILQKALESQHSSSQG